LSDIVERATRQHVEALLDARLKDSRVVEVETAEGIEERLTRWAKFYVGIPSAILVAVLALFGISKFADFTNVIEAKKADLEKALSQRQGQIDAIKTKGDALDQQYVDLESRLPRYKLLDQKLEQLAQQQTALAQKVDRVEKLAFEPSASLPPELEEKLRSALVAFRSYCERVGFKPGKGNITVSLKHDNTGAISYFDPRRNLMFVNPRYANDLDVLYREYTNHVLTSSPYQYSAEAFHWIAIESALAAYYPCSFSGKPIFGELSARLHPAEFPSWNLENNRSFTENIASDYTSAFGNGTLVWGGAFWEMRKSVGQTQADKLLLSAWMAVSPEDFLKNDPRIFVNRLLEVAQSGGESRAMEIRAIFVRRGLKL
jgi:hypothetical protein